MLCEVRPEVEGLDHVTPGPIVMVGRHARIPDALLPAWLLGQLHMRPRYVMKSDLLFDPYVDTVAQRVPNHIVDRDPEDSGPELAALERLAAGMGSLDAAVIFPEGAVASAARLARTRAG